MAAAKALASEPSAGAVQSLTAALKDEDPGVRSSAAFALVRSGEEGIGALLAAYSEEELTSATRDYERLIRLGRPGSEAILITALFSPISMPVLGLPEPYLRCGNPWLEASVIAWAEREGLRIQYTTLGPGGGPNGGSQPSE